MSGSLLGHVALTYPTTSGSLLGHVAPFPSANFSYMRSQVSKILNVRFFSRVQIVYRGCDYQRSFWHISDNRYAWIEVTWSRLFYYRMAEIDCQDMIHTSLRPANSLVHLWMMVLHVVFGHTSSLIWYDFPSRNTSNRPASDVTLQLDYRFLSMTLPLL